MGIVVVEWVETLTPGAEDCSTLPGSGCRPSRGSGLLGLERGWGGVPLTE